MSEVYSGPMGAREDEDTVYESPQPKDTTHADIVYASVILTVMDEITECNVSPYVVEKITSVDLLPEESTNGFISDLSQKNVEQMYEAMDEYHSTRAAMLLYQLHSIGVLDNTKQARDVLGRIERIHTVKPRTTFELTNIFKPLMELDPAVERLFKAGVTNAYICRLMDVYEKLQKYGKLNLDIYQLYEYIGEYYDTLTATSMITCFGMMDSPYDMMAIPDFIPAFAEYLSGSCTS